MTETAPSPAAQQIAGLSPAPQPSPTSRATAVETLLAMDRRLAGLTAAVEGFAVRQQELHARDYAPELAAIQAKWEKARTAFDHLSAKPALSLSPESLTDKIEMAGATLRKADHEALAHARRDLREMIGAIGSVAASARTARDQNRWLAGAVVAAMVLGCILGAFVPTAIDRAVPTNWHWPEQRAAKILGVDEWTAGERLMQVADPEEARRVQAALQLASLNADALARCSVRAAKAREAKPCTILVAPDRGSSGASSNDR